MYVLSVECTIAYEVLNVYFDNNLNNEAYFYTFSNIFESLNYILSSADWRTGSSLG